MPTFSFLYAPARLTTHLRFENRDFVTRLQNALLPLHLIGEIHSFGAAFSPDNYRRTIA